MPATGPVILMSNHQSNLDPPIIGWSIERPLNMPGKQELFRIPVLRQIITGLGCYPVDREAADAGSLRRSLTVLRRGHVLAVFPEGTRSRNGDIGPFEPTLTRLGLREGVPVVPVSIRGALEILPPRKILPRLPGRIWVRFGPPVDLSGYGRKVSDEQLAEINESIRQKVIELYATEAG